MYDLVSKDPDSKLNLIFYDNFSINAFYFVTM